MGPPGSQTRIKEPTYYVDSGGHIRPKPGAAEKGTSPLVRSPSLGLRLAPARMQRVPRSSGPVPA